MIFCLPGGLRPLHNLPKIVSGGKKLKKLSSRKIMTISALVLEI